MTYRKWRFNYRDPHYRRIHNIPLLFVFSSLWNRHDRFFYFYILRGKRCETTAGRFSCPDRSAVCSRYTYIHLSYTHIHISWTTSERSHAKLTRGRRIIIYIRRFMYIIYYIYTSEFLGWCDARKYIYIYFFLFLHPPDARTRRRCRRFIRVCNALGDAIFDLSLNHVPAYVLLIYCVQIPNNVCLY